MDYVSHSVTINNKARLGFLVYLVLFIFVVAISGNILNVAGDPLMMKNADLESVPRNPDLQSWWTTIKKKDGTVVGDNYMASNEFAAGTIFLGITFLIFLYNLLSRDSVGWIGITTAFVSTIVGMSLMAASIFATLKASAYCTNLCNVHRGGVPPAPAPAPAAPPVQS
jgi:hypothetical protein